MHVTVITVRLHSNLSLLRSRCENISPSGLCKECKKVTWLCARLTMVPFFCVKPVMPDGWTIVVMVVYLHLTEARADLKHSLTRYCLSVQTVLLLKLEVAPG